jgi:hypothetical protein
MTMAAKVRATRAQRGRESPQKKTTGKQAMPSRNVVRGRKMMLRAGWISIRSGVAESTLRSR